ncbi:MAG: AMP-binding protein [Leptospirales bacterium]
MDNLTQMFKESSEKFADRPAFASRDKDKKYNTITYSELFQTAEQLSMGLINEGVKAKEHVGIFADNRLEWILADMAVILAGAADVPRGTDVNEHDITYIVPHSDMKVLFVQNTAIYERVKKIKRKLPNLKKIIIMDSSEKTPKGALSMSGLIEKGKTLIEKNRKELDNRFKKIKPSDLCTLIYTSGTTGTPKGVMLTHENLVAQLKNVPIHLFPEDRLVSILPIWHIFERTIEMISLNSGSCTYYSTIRDLKENFQLVKPTMMASAPRVWESLYNGVHTMIAKSPGIKQKLFGAAYFLSNHYNRALRFLSGKELRISGGNLLIRVGRVIPEALVLTLLFLPEKLLDTIVLKKIRKATGGAFRGTISGGGALPMHVDKFFNNIGIPVLEGYGLTETSPVLAVRTFDNLVVGTIGPPVPETEIKFLDLETKEQIYPGKKGVKGELWVKGPQVMKGYYKNPKMTKSVLTADGWFNTGDLGMVTHNDCIKLYGRTKDTIVLMSGENVEPVPIENMLNQSHYIDNCMLVGQDEKNLGVLIVPSAIELEKYGKTLKQIAKNEQVQELVKSEIKRLINADNGFKPYERVVSFKILEKPFQMGEELTAKLSIKRHVVTKQYQADIAKFYK